MQIINSLSERARMKGKKSVCARIKKGNTHRKCKTMLLNCLAWRARAACRKYANKEKNNLWFYEYHYQEVEPLSNGKNTMRKDSARKVATGIGLTPMRSRWIQNSERKKWQYEWKQTRRANELQWKIILTVSHERFGGFNTKKVDAVVGAATTLRNTYTIGNTEKTRIGKNNAVIIYDSTLPSLSGLWCL